MLVCVFKKSFNFHVTVLAKYIAIKIHLYNPFISLVRLPMAIPRLIYQLPFLVVPVYSEFFIYTFVQIKMGNEKWRRIWRRNLLNPWSLHIAAFLLPCSTVLMTCYRSWLKHNLKIVSSLNVQNVIFGFLDIFIQDTLYLRMWCISSKVSGKLEDSCVAFSRRYSWWISIAKDVLLKFGEKGEKASALVLVQERGSGVDLSKILI